MPTLLWGKANNPVPPAYAKALQTPLPNAGVKIIERWGHCPSWSGRMIFKILSRSFFAGSSAIARDYWLRMPGLKEFHDYTE